LTDCVYNKNSQAVSKKKEEEMKRILVLFLVLMVASSVYAFEAGTKNVGGFIEWQSVKANKDADGTTYFTIFPMIGYFFMDNICADILLEYSSWDDKDLEEKGTDFGLGIGGRYFYNNIYGGAGFLMESLKTENDADFEASGNYLYFLAGYLYPIADNVYVDIGFDYFMGMGEYGGDWEGTDNEESGFGFGAGLDIFFK